MCIYPVVIATLNRYEHFKKCVESLSQCLYADRTELIVGLDYPPSEKYYEGYLKVKEFLPKISGFGKVTIFERSVNFGPSKNFRALCEYASSKYDAYISTEDDNIFSPCFLEYTNRALEYYALDDRVLSVGGYASHLFNLDKDADPFLCSDFCAWGLGRWFKKDAILTTVRDNKQWHKQVLSSARSAARIARCYPALLNMFIAMVENNDIWGDVIYTAYNILNGTYQVRPGFSLVCNCGYDGSGVHCRSSDGGRMAAQKISAEKRYLAGFSGLKVNNSALCRQCIDDACPTEAYNRRLLRKYIKYRANSNVAYWLLDATFRVHSKMKRVWPLCKYDLDVNGINGNTSY